MLEIRRYVNPAGKDVFGEWVAGLKDNRARVQIVKRLDRLARGHAGDCKVLRDGVHELRIHYGSGYRIYFGRVGKTVILLLGGGTKRRQSKDIERAVSAFRDFQERHQ